MVLLGLIFGLVVFGVYAYPIVEGYMLLNRISRIVLNDGELQLKLKRKLHDRARLNEHVVASISTLNLAAVLKLAAAELGRSFYTFLGIYLLFGTISLLSIECKCNLYITSGFVGASIVLAYIYILRLISLSNMAKATLKLEKGG